MTDPFRSSTPGHSDPVLPPGVSSERRRYEPGRRPTEPRNRRREAWSEFRRAYPGIIAVTLVAIVGFLALDAWMLSKRLRYAAEIEQLRSEMSDAERRRADLAVAANENKVRVMLELVRRQARLDEAIHLSVSLDSGTVVLEREGAILRVIPADIGPERWVRTVSDSVLMATPRGKRTIERVVRGSDAWEVPAWVYADQGVASPVQRSIEGALGPVALLLDGGTVVYSLPTAGPLADSSYVLPGSVRVPAADLEAVLPNISAGTPIYFY